MQKYDKIKDLQSNQFKRLTGVSKTVFQTMVTIPILLYTFIPNLL